MEVVASILGSPVKETARILCGSIYSNTRNALKFQSNLNALKQKLKILIERREEINLAVVTAHQLKEWLREVEEIEKEANSMQADTTGNCSILCGCCLNYRVGKKVAEKLEEVNRLMKDFPAGMVDENRRVKPAVYIPGPTIESQTTASQNLVKVMDLLNDDKVRRIGVWGMGGVGKTTLVKNLNNKLESNSLQQPFDIVVWVTVSSKLDLRKVQTQIAERLRLEVKPEESEQGMAVKMYERLKKGKKFLLILDDIWDTIDLDSLGVPQPEIHMGSKIVLTSRSSEVCQGMKVDAEVKVAVLNDEEAWQLFISNAGREANSEHIKPIAEAIAKECCGLPLALIIVGTAMRGKAMIEQWKDALKELQRSEPYNIRGIEEKVYRPLRWSYDTLQGNIKPCFLYCSLFPEDFSIEVDHLVQYWRADGLIDEQLNYEDSRNRGISIIENLKNSCLLEDGMMEGTVKMHDVVRDVAIWIASSMENGCKFNVQSGMGLSEMSNFEMLKSCKRISFMNKNLETLPNCAIQCPRASTLLLQFNVNLERVPEQFLVGFQALRVLDMTRTAIQTLPLSLNKMNELRALVLSECWSLKEVPPVGGLRKLQVLDLSLTGISELPKGMEELSNLRQLILSHTYQLTTIRGEEICKLCNLEILDMEKCPYMWGAKGEVEGEASFEELRCLSRLIVVNIVLRNSVLYVSSTEDVIWIKRLRMFSITFSGLEVSVVAGRSEFDERIVSLKNLDLSEIRIGWLLINALLIDATSLKLYSSGEIGWLFEYLVTNTQGLLCVKFLSIVASRGLGRVSGCAAHYDLLPNLEELSLTLDVESVWQLVVPLGLRFSRLRSINIDECSKLKYLIPHELIPYLNNLENIEVWNCSELETLFEFNNTSSSGQNMAPAPAPDPVVPKLQKLTLFRLLELRSICREKLLLMPSLEYLHVESCSQLKRLPLTSQNANTIKKITGEWEWWEELEWDDEATKLSLQPRFIELP